MTAAHEKSIIMHRTATIAHGGTLRRMVWAIVLGMVVCCLSVAPIAAQSPLGGDGFTIEGAPTGTPLGSGARLSWTAGSGQLGYVLIRFSPAGVVKLPSQDFLGPETTSFVDPTPITAYACYVLVIASPTTVYTTDALCRLPMRSLFGAGAFSLRLADPQTAALRWTVSTTFATDNHNMVISPGGSLPLPRTESAFDHHLTAPLTCFRLSYEINTPPFLPGGFGSPPPVRTEQSDMLCVIRGIATRPAAEGAAARQLLPAPGAR